jgi:predicted ATPase
MACLSVAAWALWELGYPDIAYKRSQESLAQVREIMHVYSLAAAFGFAAMHAQLRRDAPVVREQAEMAITLAVEHGFPQVLAFSTVFHGWALAQQSQVEEGIKEMRRGVNAWLATGAKAALTWFLAMLAEAYGNLGQPEEGLMKLTEAFGHVHDTGERFYEAELYRIKGELTLQSQVPSPRSKVEEAEACFLKAIEIAQKQQAKSLELRASMSLARLWQQQGKGTEAHRILSEVYNWFTEGFDTKDLQEAKALLAELAE